MTETQTDKWVKYARTEKFKVIDTVGVPHPYCITPKHVAHASDHFHGMLGIEAVESAEKAGAVCDICKQGKRKHGQPILPYAEHKQALLVEVNDERDLNKIPELHAYLLGIKAQAEADGYVGFAFVKAKGIK